MSRRAILGALLAAPAVVACAPAAPGGAPAPSTTPDPAGDYGPALADLERRHDARLGLFAVNTRTGSVVQHRQDERFAVCSVFKTYAAAALLRANRLDSGYFAKVIRYGRADIVPNSPVTEQHVDTGMTVADLCHATITRSDNAAGNLLLRELGGPQAIAPFARAIGDPSTRLDRWEPNLGTAIPGDERDTTTPAGIAAGFRALLLGDALGGPERDQLTAWLLANVTGDKRIRAGLPPTWRTGEKTGTGDYGSANDVGVTWTENGDPIIIAALSSRPRPEDEPNDTVLADAARVVADHLR